MPRIEALSAEYPNGEINAAMFIAHINKTQSIIQNVTHSLRKFLFLNNSFTPPQIFSTFLSIDETLGGISGFSL